MAESFQENPSQEIQLLKVVPQEDDISRAAVQEIAQAGISTPVSVLPYVEQIQQSFGHHDVSQIQAHLGGKATASARAMQSAAYATGEHVVFAEEPTLHTAAHEAAHVIQQRSGVQLAGGIGKVEDTYEQHAEAVARQVVVGQSAEELLDHSAGTQSETTHTPVNMNLSSQEGGSQRGHAFAVQRTILADTDLEAFRVPLQPLPPFEGARAYAQEFEIYQSAKRLATLYHMEAYSLEKVQAGKLKRDEPLIIVAHAFGNQFTKLSLEDFEEVLRQWGLESGMRVVFAGCATSKARAYQDVINKLVYTYPVVNEDLAFTSKTSEFTIKGSTAQDLYDDFQKTLSQLDQQYVKEQEGALRGLADDISSDDEKTIERRNELFRLLAPRIGQSYKGKKIEEQKTNDQKLTYLQATWSDIIDQAFNNKETDHLIRYIENIRKFLQYELKNPDIKDEAVLRYLDAYTTSRRQVETEIKRANNNFIETMEKTLPITTKDYLSIAKRPMMASLS